MLTELRVRNFKRFQEIRIELGNPVVFVGPNNSGKTTALQVLALWSLGVQRWIEKRGFEDMPEKRPGVTLNRRDLLTIPVASAKLLWRDLHVRDAIRENGKTKTRNVLIEVEVNGVEGGEEWTCGLEFDYANEESFYCRPLRTETQAGKVTERMPVPREVHGVQVAFLPPMSGLSSEEVRLDPGAIQVRLGEGKTAEVLRNLCHQVVERDERQGASRWPAIVERIEQLFGVRLEDPRYIPERGEIQMAYTERSARLDLASAGRGLQQTLLLLTYLADNPGSLILVDEPDAHLEILRQREIYRTLTETAREMGSQVVVASHSEVVLNEAADRDVVVAFVGEPHRIDDRGTQVRKALKEIGFEQYLLAEQTGWVLYLEGATDLAILQAFARRLDHPARRRLERPFVHYIENQPMKARDHFYGLREARPNLVGMVLTDRLDKDSLPETEELREHRWRRREIENYLCQPDTLRAFAEAGAVDLAAGPLFEAVNRSRFRDAMDRAIQDLVPPVALRDLADPWWRDSKATDEFLDRLFASFYQALGLSDNLMRKSDYHRLAEFVPLEDLDDEIEDVLDLIQKVAEQAQGGELP